MTFALPWEPDVILPAQYQPRGIEQPERRLLIAVLEDALDIIRKPVPADCARSHARHAEIWAWFQSRERGRVFAFDMICEVLGFDADAVRATLTDYAPRPMGTPPRPGGNPPYHGKIGPCILSLLRAYGSIRCRQLWRMVRAILGYDVAESAVDSALRTLLAHGEVTRDGYAWRVTG